MSICSSLSVVTTVTPSRKSIRSRGLTDQVGDGTNKCLIDMSKAEPITMTTKVGMMRQEASVVEYKNMKFLITERPSEKTMGTFIKEIKGHSATCVVRVGGTSYDIDRLVENGIQVIDLPYEDGTAPTVDIIRRWFQLLHSSRSESGGAVCVAIHCVAGLGRAPVLVAIALIELGMKYEDAVEYIRERRRGAINAKQLDFLSKYRPKSRLSAKNKSCRIM